MSERDSASTLPFLAAEEEQRLVLLLQNALCPKAIDREQHERLLQAALEDPLAPASAEELIESERLRQALAGDGHHPELDLARALAAAYAPGSRAANSGPLLTAAPSATGLGRGRKVIELRFRAAAILVLAAAGVLLAVLPQRRGASDKTADLPAFALAQSRSTAALFRSELASAPSARIDRIASARERELRENRYALWGVR